MNIRCGCRNCIFCRLKRLCGTRSVLVRLPNNACVARQQCLCGSAGRYVVGRNKAFGGAFGRFFVCFGCKYFAICLDDRRIVRVRFEKSAARPSGRKYAILADLGVQSVRMIVGPFLLFFRPSGRLSEIICIFADILRIFIRGNEGLKTEAL